MIKCYPPARLILTSHILSQYCYSDIQSAPSKHGKYRLSSQKLISSTSTAHHLSTSKATFWPLMMISACPIHTATDWQII